MTDGLRSDAISSNHGNMSGKLLVLLATSDSHFREDVFEILTKKSYTITVVESSKDVLEKLITHDFDVLIFDPKLKALDSSDAIEFIRKLRPKLPVIVCSDDTSFETEVKIAQAGVYFRLNRPLDIDITTELMNSLEDRKPKQN